jgi:4-methylaminobutanoate oxidase (formaldehyde-forming)
MLIDGLAIVKDLEARTRARIFHQTGSLRLAQTPERAAEIRDHVAMGKAIGFDVDHLSRDEVQTLLPYMRVDDLLDACYCPTDGHLQPAELAAAFTRVGREHGVVLATHTPAERVVIAGGRVTGVRAGGETFFAPVVVNATGPWSYLVAELAETRLPTAAIGHYYLTTRPTPDVIIDRTSPAVRDRENRIYSRPESDGLIVGIYEATPVIYDMEKLPADFDMSAMHVARDNLNVAMLIDAAGKRFGFINERTPMTVTTGIMTFTPDGNPFCGRVPDIEGLYHCTGFCGHGIVQSPTIGVIMAELILDGKTRYDIEQIEADRYFDTPAFQQRANVKQACYETYANYYGKVATTKE